MIGPQPLADVVWATEHFRRAEGDPPAFTGRDYEIVVSFRNRLGALFYFSEVVARRQDLTP